MRTVSLLFLLVCTLFQSCKAQQLQTTKPIIENHLKGDLDYVNEGLELVQKQQNGQEISLGKIDTNGTIHFNLPEFNIKALYDSIPLQHYNFHQLFLMNSDCKNRDIFEATPFDDVYTQSYDPMYIKKYGENIAILFPATDEKMFRNNNYYRSNSYDGKSLTTGSKYYWFYIDRAIDFKDNCIKNTANSELTVSANIKLEKGWNFIEESLLSTQKYIVNDYKGVKPKEIKFAKSSPNAKKIKWFLIQIMKDEEIEAAKKLFELKPITQEQFEKWLPKKAGDFTKTSYELDKKLDRSSSKTNNVFFVLENGNQKIEIAVLDCAKSPDDLEMANFAFAMDEKYKREDKPANDSITNKGEERHISKENKENKTAQILSVFKDRIILQASGENITAEKLWELIASLQVSAILE